MRKVPFMPNTSRRRVTSGAKIKVPTPEPHITIPVTKARLFSKYNPTVTTHGIATIQKANPQMTPIVTK